MSSRRCYIRRLLRHLPRGILTRRTHMAVTADKSADATAIRPFTIETPEADLDDLRARADRFGVS